MTRRKPVSLLLFGALIFSICLSCGGNRLNPTVEVEETVRDYLPPDNGSSPLWCYGSTVIVRLGEKVFLSIPETGADIPPLCNTRWQLNVRDNNGWRVAQYAQNYRQREPCPLAGFSDGRLFLSVNPSLTPPGTKYLECDPHLLRFSADNPEAAPGEVRPVWTEQGGAGYFTDHSYRGLGVDGPSGEILLLNIHARQSDQFWSYRDSDGAWTANGRITFPVRSCYPQVALKNGAGHIMAIGDIIEPVKEWREYKYAELKRDWDYVFRSLAYVWTPDITRTGFSKPLEIDNVDSTAGHITNLDLWIDSDGAAHVLYLKRSIQYDFLRDKFFPGQPMTTSLEYCVVDKGEVIRRKTLAVGDEDKSGELPGYGRFHTTATGKFYAIYYCGGEDENGVEISENRILRILPETKNARPVTLDIKDPFRRFFTATERGGSAPSDILDIYGICSERTVLRYARVTGLD
ncbi:hypothetical protein ACFLT7_03575 [candidate division KSB1 bacterium]